jgi:oligoribonuclease
MKNNPYLVWIDLEMTGLDPERHVILEIASIITNGSLEIVAEGPNLAIRHAPEVFSAMEPWSRRHHEASGLTARAMASAYDTPSAEDETLAFVSSHCRKGKSPLCGNSIWQDRRFLSKHMPRLEAFFHYRNIDVSSVKELVNRWYPRLPRYVKRKTHLAMDDIRESIGELAYYREKVFISH